MRNALRIVLLGVVVSLATGEAFTSFAQAPEETTIVLREQFTPQGWVRTWTASGAINDSGTWRGQWYDSGSIEHSPKAGAFRAVYVLTGEDNSSMTLHALGLFLLEDGTLSDKGSWYVADASGQYATLHGAGRYTGSISWPPYVVTWTMVGIVRLSQ